MNNSVHFVHPGVFRTRDGGSTWAEIEANMPNIIVTELALHKSDNTLYVSTMISTKK